MDEYLSPEDTDSPMPIGITPLIVSVLSCPAILHLPCIRAPGQVSAQMLLV